MRIGLWASLAVLLSNPALAAKDYEARAAYYMATTDQAVQALSRVQPSSNFSFEWRDQVIDAPYIYASAALQFGLPGLAQSALASSNSSDLIRLALAEYQYTSGDIAAATATLGSKKYRSDVARAQSQYLRGQLAIADNQIEQAGNIFNKWKGKSPLQAYLALNIGIWLAENNQLPQSTQWLRQAALMPLPESEEWATLKDRANVYLGSVYNWMGKPALARKALEKVRLDGVDANRALLGLGWTDVARSQSKEALAPWSYLSEQKQSDPSVQESYLLVPFALGRLNAHGKASNVLSKAIRIYGQEITLLQAAQKQLTQGRLLKSISQAYLQGKDSWLASMREALGAELTVYMSEALKSAQLNGLVQSYIEIDEMQRQLLQWRGRGKGLQKKMLSLQNAYAGKINAALQQEFAVQIARLQEYKSHANFSLAESYERVADSYAGSE